MEEPLLPRPLISPEYLCSVMSSVLSARLIFQCVSARLIPALTCLSSLFVPLPLLPSQSLWGCGPRPVILCKLGLKLTASVSVSLLLFCPTGSLQLLRLCPRCCLWLRPLCRCVCPFLPPGPPVFCSLFLLFLCPQLLSPSLPGDVTGVVPLGSLPVLGSSRAPG